jgi:hypothetical protein
MQDTPPDNLPDNEAMRWVSFAELAEARGIDKASAIRLVRRRHWHRQRDNQGYVRALVPETWLSGQEDRSPDDPGDNPPDTTAFQTALTALRDAKDGEIATLREVVDGLRSTVARTEERASRAEAEASEARIRLDDANQRAEARIETERVRADAAQQRADRAETERQAVLGRVERGEALVANLEANVRAKDSELAQQRILTEQARQQASEQEQEAQKALQAAAELRRADEARRARGRLRRTWDGLRGR